MPALPVHPAAFLLAPARGPDGRWTPGLGDPTVMGWVTVAAYLTAAVLCLRARGRAKAACLPRLVPFWSLLALLLLALGVNKQLDLQSLFTQVGRDLAKSQGWYAQRGAVQVEFVVGLAAVVVVGLAAGGWVFREVLARVRLAFVGTGLLCAFVLLRAASFHHMDRLLKWEFVGVRMNWVLELGGLALIALGAWTFRPAPGQRGPLAYHT